MQPCLLAPCLTMLHATNWVPTPCSKMSTNALRTLSNTLISFKKCASGFESKCFYSWSMQQISRNWDVPFASISCCLTTHDFSFVKGLIFQSEPYRMTRHMQILQLFVRCELSTFKTFFAELRFFLDPISPEFCQLGEVQWNWANLVTLADVALHSWQTAKLTAEWWDFQMSVPSMLILQFLTETLQVRTGVNTLVDRNQDKKSPGTHLGLTLWLSSGFRVICSFPASKRDDNPLRTMANWSGGLTLNVSNLKYNSLPFVWRNHPKPHLMPQQAFKHLQRRPALIWGGKGRKGGRPLTLQSRCEEGKMRVLIGLQVHGILQTQEKSQLSLLVPSLWTTRLNLASLVSGCTIQHSTTLKWLTMVSKLAHPQL